MDQNYNPYRQDEGSGYPTDETVPAAPRDLQDALNSEGQPLPGDAAAPDMEETGAEAQVEDEVRGASRPPSDALKDAWKQVESIGAAVGAALQQRGNVVMVRVNDEALRHLDMLVEAEVAKSRSEAAALLINEGIKANSSLFSRIGEITEKIASLRSELRESVRRDPTA